MSSNENQHEMLVEGGGEDIQGDRAVQPMMHPTGSIKFVCYIIFGRAVAIRLVLSIKPGFLQRQTIWDLWWKSGSGTSFSPCTSVFFCQYSFHPYTLFILLLSGRLSLGLLAVVRQAHRLSSPQK